MSKLEAGRETDALVAEKVMGIEFWVERRGDYSLAVWRTPDRREPWTDFRNGEAEKDRYRKVGASEAVSVGFFGDGPPRFSTSIEAAWEVVEKLRGSMCGRAGASAIFV